MSDFDAVLMGHARAAARSADQWRDYALELEAALNMTRANNAGNKAVKDAVLLELSKLFPTHPLTIQKNRQDIFNRAASATLQKKS